MGNINGFDALKREETVGKEELDPNRDFPFDVLPKDGCLRTTTAQIIDAIFRRYLIVGTITFHGGDNSITYPWGNFAHAKNPQTGDHIALASIAQAL